MKNSSRTQENDNNNTSGGRLKPYVTPFVAWGLSFGCAVGWGAFVMPANTFLPMAGPVGSLIGLGLGALVMLVIAWNYHRMMNAYPESGGAYTYTKHMFGMDHGFLCAWFLLLTYIAVLWANLTAVALITRQVFGSHLQWGFHYNLWGFDIYFGEVLTELVILAALCLLCIYSKGIAGYNNAILAWILIMGIIILSVLAISHYPDAATRISPLFSPGRNVPLGILSLVALAPWAFVGLENISHSVEEFTFPVKRSMMIFVGSVTASFLGYALPTLVAAVTYPNVYSSWDEYISRLDILSGIVSMPVFNGVKTTAGNAGLVFLAVTISAGILTGIIGNIIAASRLLYCLGRENIIPAWFARTEKDGSIRNAILFIFMCTIPIPFFGRAATGWIVDVTIIGATVIYGYTSAAAAIKAKKENDSTTRITGLIGLAFSVFFSAWLLIPNLWSVSNLAAESYLILAIWGILGFAVFRYVINRDEDYRFGKSSVVWISMIIMIFFTSMIWMRLSTRDGMERVIEEIALFYRHRMEVLDIDVSDPKILADGAYLKNIIDRVGSILLNSSLLQLILIAATMIIVISMYSTVIRREEEMKVAKKEAEESNLAKSVFLSNMSHDIRTPMNAIMGYITLAEDDDIDLDTLKGYLKKIKGSSQHLLALINDVLEMSRIESGKMELELVPCDITEVMDDMRDMFATQMSEKYIRYRVDTEGAEHGAVLADKNRLNRILLNLISNAYKFTPVGGEIDVTLRQLSDERLQSFEGEFAQDDIRDALLDRHNDIEITGRGLYEIRVKDSGIGMSEEFAANVFEAFERERNSTVSGIQGTGLGMSITKNFVDMMDGDIYVNTAQGKGSEFVVSIVLPQIEEVEDDKGTDRRDDEEETGEVSFKGKRLLLADDMDVNREIANMLLMGMGFEVETAKNGREALDMVSKHSKKYYDAVLMDIQMPVMDGYEASRAIRGLENAEVSQVPIIAMTANAFSEDVQNALDAGMNAHIAKPIDVEVMTRTFKKILF